MVDVKQLAERFVELIEERDFIVEFNDGYNERCTEIDDVLHTIIKQISSREMEMFNELINEGGVNQNADEDLKKAITAIFD
ncbi:MAG TPA: hypothetical protein V6D21_16355 [Candidatus Obscuribacterales bacterium]